MTPSSASNPFAALRQFARKRKQGERCELCGADLPAVHQHLLEIEKRRLTCSCDACAILFSGEHPRFRRVPRDVRRLTEFALSDAQWEDVRIPIDLAFFYHSTPAGRVVAMYPSPAGATESLLPLDSWAALVDANPILRDLQPDVEALLVHRIGPSPQYYTVPIDECFKLVGLIRTHWRGLSGGTEMWKEIGGFFASLQERSPTRGGAHA